DISLSILPYNWNSFDLKSFSRDKQLWDFQQKAVENALKLLWKYYEDLKDFQNNEKLSANTERKKKLFEWYRNNGLKDELDIRLDKRSRSIFNLLTEYYSSEDKKIPYWNYINRMCFWMATGSGKTIVIIKIIKILKQLMARGEIPEYDILFLTHRDDLIEQFKKMMDEVNYANADKIELQELKEYPEVKRQKSLFGTPIFYYRSDNIGDEQKEKIIDFRNYDNGGDGIYSWMRHTKEIKRILKDSIYIPFFQEMGFYLISLLPLPTHEMLSHQHLSLTFLHLLKKVMESISVY
ncbi:hypothetical protein DRN73_10045, partial [Candidatus Pacearchaeota archaeon]